MAEIFTRFDSNNDVVSNLRQTVSSGMWSGGTGTLTTFHTSSVQSGSTGRYFYEVYKDNPASDTTAEVQFSVAYGHFDGSGSYGQTNNFPSKAIYRQYAQLVFGDEDSNFVFDGFESNDIWVINIARGSYKHALKAGSLNLKLHPADASVFSDFFTDDSVTQTGSAVITNLGRQFNLVSGSDGVMSGSKLTQTSHYTTFGSKDSGSFGFVYPDAGVIIFNASALRSFSESPLASKINNAST